MKEKKKKTPIVNKKTTTTSIQSFVESQKIISTFHTLKKKLKQEKNEELKKQIQSQIDSMGGLDGYQQASIFNENNYGDTSKWVIKELKQIFTFEKRVEMKRPISLLDVGALKHHYKQYDYIQCTAIDLHSQEEHVQQVDFFDYFIQHKDHFFDVIVLSLVVNFVDDPKKRGEMLRIASQHCKYLIFIVPKACIDNSRYFDMDVLIQIMQSMSMTLHSHTRSEKLFFSLFSKQEQSHSTSSTVTGLEKRQMKRIGSTFNNFTILL